MMKRWLSVYMLLIFFVLILFTGCGQKEEYHHVFPQQYRNYFEQRGIDIDKYTLKLTKEDHRGSLNSLHSNGWNKQWAEWIENHPNASKKEIFNYLNKMLSKNGYQGNTLTFYDYKSKKPVGTIEVKYDNVFYYILGSLGKLLRSICGGEDSPCYQFFQFIGILIASMFGIRLGGDSAAGLGLAAIIAIILLFYTGHFLIALSIIGILLIFAILSG